jgi:hypothetical protein
MIAPVCSNYQNLNGPMAISSVPNMGTENVVQETRNLVVNVPNVGTLVR